jgi:Family of unknown function (DUF5906)
MSGLLARNSSNAEEVIRELVQECWDGESDREEGCVKLAELWRLDVEGVRKRFAKARELRGNGGGFAGALDAKIAEKAKPAPKALNGEIQTGPYKGQPFKRGRILGLKPEPQPAAGPEKVEDEGPLRETEAAPKASAEPEADFKDKLEAAQPKPEVQAEPDEVEAVAEPVKAGLPAVVISAPPLVPQPTLDDALALMNSRHAILENVGGKTAIGCWEQSDDGYFKLAYHGKESFLLRYSNATITIEAPDGRGGLRPITVDLAKWWLDHRNRAQYRGVKFRPNREGVVNGYLNLWRRWGVEPKPGDWSLIQQHIVDVIAGGNAEFAEYVLRWIAWAIQNPDKQAEVALVLIGEKGTGKGTLGRCLERIFGAHALQVTDREQVIGRFNGHLEDCILFIADEAYWGGDKRCVGKLQGMITERNLPIERKGFDMYSVKNFLHVLMLAEPGWVIPAGRFERRYAALKVSEVRRGDKDYFKALNRQMAGGGVEAMFYDLLEVELGDWHPREIPDALLKGEALAEQQTRTLPPWEQWYLSLLRDGRLPGAWVKKKKPHIAYTSCLISDAREQVPRLKWESDVALTDFLKEKGCEKHRASTGNGWKFLPLAEARAAFEQAHGPQPWDNPEGEWGDKVGEGSVEGSDG